MSSASYSSISNVYLNNYLANSIAILRKHNSFCDALLARAGGKLDGSSWRRMGRTEQEWVSEALNCAANQTSVTIANVCDALYDAGLGDLATRVAAHATGVPFAVISASNFAPIGRSSYQPGAPQTAPQTKGRRTLVLKKKQPLPNFLIIAHEDAEHLVVDTELIETKAIAMEYLNVAAKDPEACRFPHGAYTLIGTGSCADGDVAMLEAGIAEVADDEEAEPAEGPAIKLSNAVPAAATKSGTVLKYGSRKIASKPADPLHAVIIIGRNSANEYQVIIPDDDQPRFTPSSAAKILAEQVLPEFPDDEFGIYANMSKTKTKITKGTVQKVSGLKISGK